MNPDQDAVDIDEDPQGVASPESMEPDSSPTQMARGASGVRRVNNLPMYIGGAVALGFAMVMLIVAAHRAQHAAPPSAGTPVAETANDKTNGDTAARMAALIAGKGHGAITPASGGPLGQPGDGVGITTPSDGGPPLPPGGSGADEPVTPNGPQTPAQQERARMLALKRQQFEDAIKAPTIVGAGIARSSGSAPMMASVGSGSLEGAPGIGGYSATSYSAQSPQLEQLEAARRHIESERARATQTAQGLNARLAQWQQGAGSAPPAEAGAIPASIQTTAAASAVGSAAIMSQGALSPTAPNVSSARQTLTGDAMRQFDSKDPDRWSLGTDVTVPQSLYELRAGAVIPAILISGINSDLPGQILAQVSENVFDTAHGNYLLLPQGSRLIGEYTSAVAYGQARLMVAWKRIVFPDGKALDIGAMPGTDAGGYAGMHDQVNNHYVRLFAGAVMLSAITAGVSLSQPQQQMVSAYPTTSQALSQALGLQLGQTATQLLQKNMNIAPTLEIRPGYRLNVMVTKDMVFSKAYEAFDY